MDYSEFSAQALMQNHASILLELKQRGIIRTANNPVGDLAEYLFCKAFDWQQEGNSKSGYDALDAEKCRYQIKSRRIHQANKSSQLSAMRNLDQQPFDMLAVIIFEENYMIRQAAIAPYRLVFDASSYRSHVNGWLFHARDAFFEHEDVHCVKQEIEAVFSAI